MNMRAHCVFAILCMIRAPAHAAFVFPVSHPLPRPIIFSVPPALGRAGIQPALLPRAALSNQFRVQSARQTRSGVQQDFSALSFAIPAIMHLIKKIGVGGEECQNQEERALRIRRTRRLRIRSQVARSSLFVSSDKTRESIVLQEHASLEELLSNFQQVFLVSEHWIRRFSLALLEKKKKIVVFFVDLDNVPRFFKTFTLDTLQQIERRMPCETFVVCSSCQIYEHQRILEGNWNQQQLNRIHFTLANAHKDSADAVCTVESLNLKKWKNQHKTAK